MLSLEEIKKIKEEHENEWLGYENVVGVDIGNKFVNHNRTNDLSIRVLVKTKEEEGYEIPTGEEIPETIEGVVTTDVIKREFSILKDSGGSSQVLSNQKLKGGIGIGYGTLGAIVRSRDRSSKSSRNGDLMLLSCDHVLASYTEGGQLSISKSNYRIKSKKGRVNKYHVAQLTNPIAEFGTGLDCAVVEIEAVPAAQPPSYTSEISGIGRVRGTAKAKKGMEIRKCGRKTELTYGLIESVSLTMKVGNELYYDQIGIVPDLMRNREFAADGDSGSVIVNNDSEAVGLLIARCDDGLYCAATPIEAVLDKLEVDIYEEELSGLDKDIDESVRAIAMPPPPLTEDISRFLHGELIGGDCCCKCCG